MTTQRTSLTRVQGAQSVHNARRRGSVLLMVVGVLTIVAMLGGTFLIVSHLDSMSSRSAIAKSQTDPVIDGVVARIMWLLANDRCIDNVKGPYGNLPSTAAGLMSYVDYPNFPNTDPVTVPDPWGGVPHDKWLAGLTYQASSFTYSNSPKAYSHKYVMSDVIPGAGTPIWMAYPTYLIKASMVDTGITDKTGNKIYVAVDIQDASSFLNVNTACSANAADFDPTMPTCPANINLQGTAPNIYASLSNVYAALHTARSANRAGVTVPTFNVESALRPTSPQGSYNRYIPFTVGDEALLRYQPDTTITTAFTGRLYNALSVNGTRTATTDDFYKYRKWLTTWNATTTTPRHPIAANDIRLPFWKLDTAANTIVPDPTFTAFDATGDTARQTLYAKILGVTGNKKLSAHVVANLWSYSAGLDFAKAYKFQPTAEAFIVYGQTEQLVISEIVAWKRAETVPAPTPSDSGFFYAIEVYNPTNQPINTQGFLLKNGAGSYDFKKPDNSYYVINPNQRLVLYHFGGMYWDNAAAVLKNIDATAAGVTGANCVEWLPLDLSANGVNLIRQAEGCDIPLDTASLTDDTNHTIGALVQGTQGGDGAARDDSPARNRALVAKYAKWSMSGLTDHTLGVSNAASPDASTPNDKYVGSAEPDLKTGKPAGDPFEFVAQGFQLDLAHTQIKTPGEFNRIWLIGPEDGATTTPVTKQLATDPVPGSAPAIAYTTDVARGRMDFSGPVGGAWAYPDIPWACLATEMIDCVPTDASRPQTPNRVYGRININTASIEVLSRLPWPTTGWNNTVTYNPTEIAEFIVGYRDRNAKAIAYFNNFIASANPTANANDVTRNYSADRAAATGITGLRTNTNTPGYLSTGELAVVLADYAKAKAQAVLGAAAATALQTNPNYLKWRDELYNAVANLVSVNSDVFVANVLVQIRGDISPGTPWVPNVNAAGDTIGSQGLKAQWRYIIVFDRGNCTKPTDRPAILLMTQVN